MPWTLGVDQGLSGGLCALGGLTNDSWKRLLTMPVRKAVGSNRPDTAKLKDWLCDLIVQYGIPSLVVVEKSQPMGEGGRSRGRQSPRALHTQGFNAGVVVGLFEVLGFSIEEPTPQRWKAAVLAGFGDKDKAAMFAVCRQRFPTLDLRSGPRAKNLHDGLADAVGLALYGQYRIGAVPR